MTLNKSVIAIVVLIAIVGVAIFVPPVRNAVTSIFGRATEEAGDASSSGATGLLRSEGGEPGKIYYIRNGEFFHRGSCESLTASERAGKSVLKGDPDKATALGMKPCPECDPPKNNAEAKQEAEAAE